MTLVHTVPAQTSHASVHSLGRSGTGTTHPRATHSIVYGPHLRVITRDLIWLVEVRLGLNQQFQALFVTSICRGKHRRPSNLQGEDGINTGMTEGIGMHCVVAYLHKGNRRCVNCIKEARGVSAHHGWSG